MIVQIVDNNNPYTIGSGYATKVQSNPITVTPDIPELDFCYCKNECSYNEQVFGSASNDWWKNDRSAFLFSKKLAADSIVIKLYKNNEELLTFTDNTYGIFYPNFSSQPLYVGLLIYWENILSAHGAATYQIKAEKDIIGSTSEYTSQLFYLQHYNAILANKTVRIESYNTGNILSSELDYNGLLTNGWYQSFRIPGFFGNKQLVYQEDNYLNNDRKIRDIVPSIIPEYTLKTGLITADVYNQILLDNILANDILITDYNLINAEAYRRKEVSPKSIEDLKYYSGSVKSNFIVKFVDRRNNIVKNNF